MATYVIGDVHGCLATLQSLWPKLDFDLDNDRLWMVGDLVNRGPDSLGVIRWARELEQRLGDRFAAVLGNHDLHLLAFAAGLRKERARDRLRQVTEAADGDQLLDWVRHRPLLYQHGRRVLVHAGILPSWSVRVAAERARAAEAILQERDWQRLLTLGLERDGADEVARETVRVLTSLRCCTAEEVLCDFSGPLSEIPRGCRPWFEARRDSESTIVFGHWAALGVHLEANTIGLDSGCVWGRQLTAIRLEDRRLFQHPNVE